MRRKKRTMTAAERARWEERKARFSELVKKVSELDDNEREELASRMPVATVEGHVLSVRNQCLVALQNEGATLVGGFRQWKEHGRHVRKGERGLMILAPSPKKITNERTGEETEEIRFRHITVFDVSQTEELEAVAS